MGELELRTNVNAAPGQVYDAWMTSAGHESITGAPAEVDPRVGGKHSAWDGYIWGETLELEPGRRIVQTWRTADFEDHHGYSKITVILAPDGEGTLLTLKHTEIPDDQVEDYRGGWEDNYFIPMKEYFG